MPPSQALQILQITYILAFRLTSTLILLQWLARLMWSGEQTGPDHFLGISLVYSIYRTIVTKILAIIMPLIQLPGMKRIIQTGLNINAIDLPLHMSMAIEILCH